MSSEREKPEETQSACRSGARDKQDEPMLFCPRCSMRLAELRCKLVCDRCGYYMSCADYY